MVEKKNEMVLAKDAIEYQPDAIELANSRLPWWARMGVIWLFAFMVGIIVWASVCKVDVIVQCNGKVISTVDNITMMPPERMVIDEVCVREGDSVKKGDVLFKFDPTINEADYKNYTDTIAKLEPAYERLLAEYEHKVYTPKNPKDRNQQIQKTMFDQRKRTYDAKLDYYDAAIASAKSQIESVKVTIANLNANLEKYSDIVKRYSWLKEKDAVSVLDLSQVQINEISYQNQRDQYLNSLPTYESQLASSKAERQAYIEDWEQKVAEEFNTAEQDLLQAKQQLNKVIRYRDYYFLNSPHDAIVHEVAKYARGSAVREAEPLITLIPVNVQYELEIEIPAKDVSKVKLGDEVRIKLTPFPFQTFGTMKGKLTNISEDVFTRNNQQPVDAARMMSGNSYYRGRVIITGEYEQTPKNFSMRPGMEAQAEIITGDRRIISYIFHPLIKMLDESVREP